MPELNLVKIASEFLEMLLVSLFCVAIINLALGKTSKSQKNATKGFAVFSVAMTVLFLLILSISTFDAVARRWYGVMEPPLLLDMTVNSVFILYNVILTLFPAVVSFFYARSAYRHEKSVTLFTSVLTGLGASIIYDYIFKLLQLPLYGEAIDTDFKSPPPFILSLILLAICLVLFYWLYRNKLDAKLKMLLDTPDGRVDSFVKIPVLSLASFAFLIATLNSFAIDPAAVYWQNTFIFIVVLGCLVIIFALMYWSIFKSITISTAAMKARAELDLAKHIQASVLPSTFPAFPTRKEFSIYATMNPAKEVGGDFYDFFFVDETHLAVVIADVSGKGVPAALFMMTARMLLKNLAATGRMPEEILAQANNQLCEGNKAQMFVTVWLGILDTDSGLLSFANAGHNPPLLMQKNGEFRYLDHKTYKRSIMLGMRKNIVYKRNEIDLVEKDVLFLYTDGVTEAVNMQNELFSEKRLKTCTDENSQADPETLLASVTAALDAFVGTAEQFDDITMLGLRLDAIPQTYETPVSAEHTADVSRFAEAFLEKSGCGSKVIHQALIAVDEIFSNIVRYSGADKATLRCLAAGQELIISFEDNGKAYNPLDAKEPDIHAPREERTIGGLGIFMVKKTMDDIRYEYRDGQNVLTLKKNWN